MCAWEPRGVASLKTNAFWCVAAGRRVFRDFLRCEYSEENILFWLACEELKKESNPDLIEEKARFIYEDYISILSPKEVCVAGQVVCIPRPSHGF